MDSLGQRVREERKARGWTEAELARRVTRQGFKISQPGIHTIEKKGHSEPKCIVQLAAALEVSAHWLQTGRGDKRAGSAVVVDFPAKADRAGAMLAASALSEPPLAHNDASPAQRITPVSWPVDRPDVPVWASAEGGGEGSMILTTEPIDWVRRSERLLNVRNPFAFHVVNSSMSPAIEHGDQVVINPAAPPRPGNDCVFIHDQGDGSMLALVKRLLRAAPDAWRVRQFNEPRDFELSRRRWSKAFVISEIRRGGI